MCTVVLKCQTGFPFERQNKIKKQNNNCSLFYLQTVSQKFFKAPQGVSPAGVCLTTTTVLSCVNNNVGLPEECVMTLKSMQPTFRLHSLVEHRVTLLCLQQDWLTKGHG